MTLLTLVDLEVLVVLLAQVALDARVFVVPLTATRYIAYVNAFHPCKKSISRYLLRDETPASYSFKLCTHHFLQ